MRSLHKAVLPLAVAVLMAAACDKSDTKYTGEYSSVFIYCGLGYNNLTGYIRENLSDMCEGILPERSRDKAIVAFFHNTCSGYDYTTPNPPVLVNIYRHEGKAVIDTLKIYPENTVGTSAATISQMMLDIQELYPAKSYGMLLSSHATGWIPPGYTTSTERSAVSTIQEELVSGQEYLPTKSVGSEFRNSSANTIEMDLKDFAECLPMHLDYMMFDACLMGGVEVAWELKDKCGKILFSPAEVLVQGLEYSSLSWNLLKGTEPDLVKICEEYMAKYDELADKMGDERYRSATISVVDCSRIGPLGDIFASIVEAHRDGLDSIDRNSVQKYFYDKKSWYYDLRDLAAEMGADAGELEALDAALADCVLFHSETPTFFGVALDRCCGLSVNIPDKTRPILDSYYRTLSWNIATGLSE